MSIRNLDKLMAPKSVVAIGASERRGSVGAAVTRNLLAGGFKGEIHLVNRKGGAIDGRPVLRTLSELPSVPDLAVIMTPAESVPALIVDLGQRGTKVAVVISSGPGVGEDGGARTMRAGVGACCAPRGRIFCASSGRTASAMPRRSWR